MFTLAAIGGDLLERWPAGGRAGGMRRKAAFTSSGTVRVVFGPRGLSTEVMLTEVLHLVFFQFLSFQGSSKE